MRAIAARGLAHPLTLALLAAASTAAARAWDAGHRVTVTHPAPLSTRERHHRACPTTKPAVVADDLHARYMRAAATWRTHLDNCRPCQDSQYCPAGAPLFERFSRLQDAYNQRLRRR
ncbi:hypothetical protein [Streptomyces sp. NPDC058394]|uniref:hypothetical protein n=1 Tax=Streptomyces sp. NPDC058394 TaxID=3346477 RepID=UPI00365E20DC